MDVDLDLDSFIATIEGTAPKEEQENPDEPTHKCQDCNIQLENIDGDFVCPSCGAQATNILLQLGETEVHTGEAMIGVQRVRSVKTKRSKHSVDYGWAWSTDEAIVHILVNQVRNLVRYFNIPKIFSQGVKNMWLKYWIKNVAPYIKDEYSENDLIPIELTKALKLRDIEVLFRVQDKVMIPERLIDKLKPVRKDYRLYGTNYTRVKSKNDDSDATSTSEDNDDGADPTNRSLAITPKEEMDPEEALDAIEDLENKLSIAMERNEISRTLKKDSVSVLTLNRTLAFIEAVSRSLELQEPIFASDIVRACNQRMIPFFGAHKCLPEGLKLNYRDKLMFQKTRPPSPLQLSKAASYLMVQVYHDDMPFTTPVPKLDIILKRFIEDMNLPHDIISYLSGHVDFNSFKQTQPLEFTKEQKKCPILPQYDRWAFAILVGLLKNTFGLDDECVTNQSDQIRSLPDYNDDMFIFKDWCLQASMRLNLIMSYDPYVMFHPMTNLNHLQPTPQVYNYVETILLDRATSSTRLVRPRAKHDDSYRSELTDFLLREIPRPPELQDEVVDEDELEKPTDSRHPISEAFNRTKRFWISSLNDEPEALQFLFKDFSKTIVRQVPRDRHTGNWPLNDDGQLNRIRDSEISDQWPYCFKLLLSLGGYLCYCNPKELLREIKFVESFLHPGLNRLRSRRRHRSQHL